MTVNRVSKGGASGVIITFQIRTINLIWVIHSRSLRSFRFPEPKENPLADLKAVLETERGNINLTLYSDKAPLTVANFVNLVQRGFYDRLNFHRVIPDFMIQGGCPQGTGTGGPGYRFADEFVPDLRHDGPGVLSMANAGPGTNGSQFFVTHIATPWLDDHHTVFGKVVSDADQDIVNEIAGDDALIKATIEGDATELLEKFKDQLDEWNEILDKTP
ncbi:MAG: peptidylprolyl isomerase [Gemmatimonadales bacterium]|nr:peptidylprolyl isomerase [Gemmatimonadales bacterium]